MLPKIYSSPRVRLALTAIALAMFTLILTSSEGNPAQAAQSQQTPTPQPSTRPHLLTDPVPDPKQAGMQYFPQTGHTLRGPFLEYWNKYGGLAQFGYPLTEEFFEEVGTDHEQYQVQYFERNRFEYHPENKGSQYEVLLGVLGRDFRQQDPPAAPLAGATYFQETGHNLSGAFKQYWDTHGGLFVHGYPLTEPSMERSTDGKEYLVQWFERSRFELHPENAGSQYEVLLGVLGRQLSEEKGYPYGWYPLYGHAANYSWFAGYYRQDPTKCRGCGCMTIHFVNPTNRTYRSVREVLPYGEDWPRVLKENRLESTVEPQTFIVVFGQLDDPNNIIVGQAPPSCSSPKFKVTSLHFNPVR
jgi:hypothetical protein